MLLSLQSTGPNYNHIQTNINIPWNCEYIEYHVASINTRDILITTHDDVIEFEYDDDDGNTVQVSNQFPTKFYIHLREILPLLRDVNNNVNVIATSFDEYDRFMFIPQFDNFKFTKITHRAGLVTGLYNIDINHIYPKNTTVIAERPIRDYSNKLYLVSKQGQAIQSNIGEEEYNPSVIASIDHVIKESAPIIQNFETYGKPIKNVVNIDSFKQIELELVDFQYKPVPLVSPMFVTIKVNPAESPKMKLK